MDEQFLPAGPLTVAQVHDEVLRANGRIRPYVRETPLEPSPFLSREGGCSVFLKMENLQVTCAFKARGAFNRLLTLSDEDRERGVVTASSGNSGNAMAHALAVLGIEGEIFVPASASPAKIEALRQRGANLRLVDGDWRTTETAARDEADRSGRLFVSPYNDPQIIAGQGTIAVEIERQMAALSPPVKLDAVLVPVGGGGLISGMGGYLKTVVPQITVVGCQPVASPVMTESVKAGRLVDIPLQSSLSDGTVGLLEKDAITFPLCKTCVDDWVVLEEEEIASALRLVMERHCVLVEGAAVLPVAAFLKTRERWSGKTAVLLLSGARIPLAKLAQVLSVSTGGSSSVTV